MIVVHFTTYSGFLKTTGLYSCHGGVGDFNHVLNEFPHSQLTFSFKPKDRESSVPHLYVTEDLSKRSFRLSIGGGPRHLARADGGGGLSWSPQIMSTMEQMTADKLQRVRWPEKRRGGGVKPAANSDPLISFTVGDRLEKARVQSWVWVFAVNL